MPSVCPGAGPSLLDELNELRMQCEPVVNAAPAAAPVQADDTGASDADVDAT